MPMKTVHCRLCGARIKGSSFAVRMKKLRRHRKRKHPTAHKKSVRKALQTKRQRGIINKKRHKKRGNPIPKELRKYTTLTPEGRKEFLKTVGRMR